MKLSTTPTVTVVAERIGWANSIRMLSERERELRPLYLAADPASRTTYVVGEIAQCDGFPMWWCRWSWGRPAPRATCRC